MNKMLRIIGVSIILLSSCSKIFQNDSDSPDIRRDNGQVYIIDNTGKQWNITHAIENYGMQAERFQFGLGPNAIPPILSPKFVSPNQSGFPAGDSRLVIGFNLDGDIRAYPIDVLTRHEIADDKFGKINVAAAY